MKRIVITGALGHIGSKLIRRLPVTFRGVELRLLDDLSTQRYCSLFNLPADARCRFHTADILTADLTSLFRDADVVVHLAAVADAASSFQNRERVEQVNVEGTRRVAEACIAAGCALLFPSTTSVYGVPSGCVDEDCAEEALRPQSPYAESKLRAERLLREMGRTRGLRYCIARLGTIVGVSPGMRFHTAVNKFVWQACVGEPLTVWRTALNQKRPYLDLDDAIRAIALLIASPDAPHDLYNVVTANATVAEIVEMIRRHVPDLAVTQVDAPIMNQFSYAVAAPRITALGLDVAPGLEPAVAATVALLRNVRSFS